MERKGVAAFGEIAIDFDRMELRRSGQLIAVTSLEFRLLKFFIDNPEYVFSREELIGAVWPSRRRASGRSVDNSIANLRRKLEPNPASPIYFHTVHGVGYKFVPVGGLVKGLNVGSRRGLISNAGSEMRSRVSPFEN